MGAREAAGDEGEERFVTDRTRARINRNANDENARPRRSSTTSFVQYSIIILETHRA